MGNMIQYARMTGYILAYASVIMLLVAMGVDAVTGSKYSLTQFTAKTIVMPSFMFFVIVSVIGILVKDLGRQFKKELEEEDNG